MEQVVNYIRPNGKVELVAKVKDPHWSEQEPGVEKPVDYHDLSLVVFINPWITIPINYYGKVLAVENMGTESIVNIPLHEKKVVKILRSGDISKRLWDASSDICKKDWESGEEERERSTSLFLL